MIAKVKRKTLRTPHDYQRRGVEWLCGHAGAGTFARPGAGKTAIVQRAVLALKDAKLLRRALVIAPLRVMNEVWPAEPTAWKGTEWDRMNTLTITPLYGNKKDKLIEQFADINVINPDGLKWLFEEGSFKQFKRAGFDTLIIDESTLFKNRDTVRFKLLSKVLNTFARRWILTGTPCPRSYMNLFSQIFIVDQGAALGRYITHYRQEYFYPVDRNGWDWALKPGSEERIQKKIAPYIFNLEPEDYKEIPIEPNVIRVELPAKARKAYDELEEEMITELAGGTVTAVNAGVASMKCSQVANGGLYYPTYVDEGTGILLAGKRTWENLHDAKTDAVEELVAELNGSPALVVYEFQHDLDRLRARFPSAPYIGRGVTAKQEKEIFAAWNRDEYPVLLTHGQSLAHGLNLQYGTCQDVIWHSLTYDLEVFDQLNMRIARQGTRHDRIFSHLIVARGTTDEARLEALRRKDKTQRGFLEALRTYCSTR